MSTHTLDIKVQGPVPLQARMTVGGQPVVAPTKLVLSAGNWVIAAPEIVDDIPIPSTPVKLGAWSIDADDVLSVMGERGTLFFPNWYFTRPAWTVASLYFGYNDFSPWEPWYPINAAAIDALISRYLSLDQSQFDGFNFLCEETYMDFINFEDGMVKNWFGETLLGHDLFGLSIGEWQAEMFLRMLRGFANWVHSKGKPVGITVSYDAWRYGPPPRFFGFDGWDYILDHFDYIVIYSYTRNLGDWSRTKEFFAHVENEVPSRIKRIGIVTRPWEQAWDREAVGLEMKYYLDKGMDVVTYTYDSPSYPQMNWKDIWALMLKSIELHQSGAPFYETYVDGTNLLTGKVGTTYGWVG